MRCSHGPEGQCAGTDDFVVPGQKVHIIRNQRNSRATARRRDHSASKRQEGLATRQFDSDGSARSIKSAVDTVIRHNIQTVGFAHINIAILCSCGSVVNYRQLRHRSIDSSQDTVSFQAHQGFWCCERGATHIQQARSIQRQVGCAPAGSPSADHTGRGRQVTYLDAIKGIGKFDGQITLLELVVVQKQRRAGRAAHRREHQPIKSNTTSDRGSARATQINKVIAITGVDGIESRANVNRVIASPTKYGVVACAHVNDFVTFATNKAVFSVSPVITYSVRTAALQHIVASSSTDNTAFTGTQNVKGVLTFPAVKVKNCIDTIADVNRVVTLTPASNNSLHTSMVSFHAERAHRQTAVALGNDRIGLIHCVVIEVAATISTGVISHIQVKRIAYLMGDHRRSAPAPKLATRNRDAHHRYAKCHVGAYRRQVNRGTEPSQCDVNIKQAQVYFKIQPTVGAGRKTRLAAKCHGQAGVQMERTHIHIEISTTRNAELTIGLDVSTHIYCQNAEEIQMPVKFELEHIIF